jgi:rubrerythrin
MKITSLNDLFEFAKGLENGAHQLYCEFARMFSHHPDAARIFRTLAEDEKTHALELENVRSGLAADQLRQSCDSELVQMAQRLSQFSVEQTIRSIANLDDAFEAAHDLENAEVNELFRLLATKSVTSGTRRRFVDSEISLHLSRLDEFTQLSLDRNARRQIVPQR